MEKAQILNDSKSGLQKSHCF